MSSFFADPYLAARHRHWIFGSANPGSKCGGHGRAGQSHSSDVLHHSRRGHIPLHPGDHGWGSQENNVIMPLSWAYTHTFNTFIHSAFKGQVFLHFVPHSIFLLLQQYKHYFFSWSQHRALYLLGVFSSFVKKTKVLEARLEETRTA